MTLWFLQSSESIDYTLVATICIIFVKANQITIIAVVIETHPYYYSKKRKPYDQERTLEFGFWSQGFVLNLPNDLK